MSRHASEIRSDLQNKVRKHVRNLVQGIEGLEESNITAIITKDFIKVRNSQKCRELLAYNPDPDTLKGEVEYPGKCPLIGDFDTDILGKVCGW